MNTKNIIIILILALLVGGGISWLRASDKSETPSGDRYGENTPIATPDGKLKAANFSGKLTEVNTGCFADGECFAVIDGKHITTTLGWRQEVVGSIQGVESIGDMEKHIGQEFEVYAQDKGDGTYTLYGSEGFYIKLK